MAQSILIFDFGTNEEAAQQARHKVEAWSQGFRLGKKILFKFEREEPAEAADTDTPSPKPSPEGKAKNKSEKKTEKKKAENADADDTAGKPEKSDSVRVRVLIKLDFSDHEKLSSQRWLDRIPSEEPFKSAKSETIRQENSTFADVAKRFDLLD
jgi:hypothetical protein